MSELPVLTRVENGVGRVTLNRPKALHALTREMCELATAALLDWRTDAGVASVLIDHAGERGFCAGGDIRMIAESGAGDGSEAKAFFHAEYRLNHLLHVYPKPVVAVMDGIVMGGGVGVSMPAKVRIATERTVFAMPETGIGLFPDVGGGWFLPRLPGEVGTWLALTGARLKAADCLAIGVATHFTSAAEIEALKARFVGSGNLEFLSPARPGESQGRESISGGESGGRDLDPGLRRNERILDPDVLADVDRHFAHDTVEAIWASLAEGSDWARAQLEVLRTKSPQSQKVTLRQLRIGRRLSSFAENMATEYRLGGRIVRTHDFQEGVRAVIVDKDNAPRWNPATLEQVPDSLLDDLFAPLPPEQEWTPLPDVSGAAR
jgi:enoyl-CoA hydratase